MRFRSIDTNNDWNFGKGKQSYFKDQDALMTNLKTRIQSFLNDCFFAIADGIDWFNLLGSKSQSDILSSVRKIIIDTDGVTRINEIDSFLNSTTRNLQITYNINTQYSLNVEQVQEVLI
ncbi:hypothetical protein KAR91_59455 [Candidatus Pacearchaeota archaeon]|nr:hypothetical protein [Candidatus Pacearchaeota archaeon]